jgi:carbon monoxide dehydrogenase subunit G
MAIRIEETFRVQAPIERVWDYLVDPRQVVGCLPGAELLEVQDERTFVGRLRAKVGPITASFKGRAQITELDPALHRVRMLGDGQDAGGSGSARLMLSSAVIALADGASEVRVEAQVDIAGRLAQFGRGVVEDVSRQVFRQFATCVRDTLEGASADGAPAPAPAAGDAPADDSAAPPASPAPSPAAVRVLPLVYSAVRRAVGRFFRRGPTRHDAGV